MKNLQGRIFGISTQRGFWLRCFLGWGVVAGRTAEAVPVQSNNMQSGTGSIGAYPMANIQIIAETKLN
jgi:hypothetical protein